MESKPKSTRKKKETFEVSLNRLEKIVQKMEDGNLALEESLQLYEQGVALTRVCSQKLEEAEKRIEILTRDEQDGIVIKSENPDKYQQEQLDVKGEN